MSLSLLGACHTCEAREPQHESSGVNTPNEVSSPGQPGGSPASPNDTAQHAIEDFFGRVWGADEHGNLSGVHFIAEKGQRGMQHHPVTSVIEAIDRANKITTAGKDVWFACAEFEDASSRKGTNARAARGFWLDLDSGAQKAARNEGYLTLEDVLLAVKQFCASAGLRKPSIIVSSGHGIHAYWWFGCDIGAVQWLTLARKLKSLARKYGLRADPSRTADIASVLRVPGTRNFKDAGKPEPVSLLRLGKASDFEEFVAALEQHEADPRSETTQTEKAAGDFPASSALEIVKHCPTLAYAAEVRGAVSEPYWRGMIGVVKFTKEGEALCHEWSEGDDRYDWAETQSKINEWTTPPTMCSTFRDLPDSKCHGCPQKCKSPIQLGYSREVGPIAAALYDLNNRYFVGRVGGNVYVFGQNDRPVLPNGMNFTAFRQFHATMIVEGAVIAVKWLSWSKRQTYDSLIFDPSGKGQEGCFNTWQGLAVTAKEGQCERILEHIRLVWCGGNQGQFEYVICWLALLVQMPWIKPEVALVLRSKEGTGKTMVVQMLLQIFGVHALRQHRRSRSQAVSTGTCSTRSLLCSRRRSSQVIPPRLQPRRRSSPTRPSATKRRGKTRSRPRTMRMLSA